VSQSTLSRVLRTVLEREGLPVGTYLENRVTWRLHSFKAPEYKWQYPVGPYQLDYAWPAQRIALEVDGPHHWRPDVAVRDVARDAFLRAHGWLIFRIDDTEGVIEGQLQRVLDVLHRMPKYSKEDDRMLFSEDGKAATEVWFERQIIRRADKLTENNS